MGDPGEGTVDLGELSVRFGYQCAVSARSSSEGSARISSSRSFSCLSGAALNANATLSNYNEDQNSPTVDSPFSFRRITSASSFSWNDVSPTSSLGSFGTLSDDSEHGRNLWRSMSENPSFLHSMNLQIAGGPAGEDRAQAVCSEENGFLFCGIYDGFNGRDAADYLAKTLYETVCFYLFTLDQQANTIFNTQSYIVDCLTAALSQAEADFLQMVEQEMEDRPDLVCVGSSVLSMLIHEDVIYVLGIGDSRAILASSSGRNGTAPKAIQLTETHTVDNIKEWKSVMSDHPDDPSPIIHGRVKGRLRLTRAFGVGYLKKAHMNDALIGILRIPSLISPPYVYSNPCTTHRKVQHHDDFVVLGSDGLFDFFKNEEVVRIVHRLMKKNPQADAARYLIEKLVQRAAKKAGLSTEDLMRIPAGMRRKYHDDVTVIVVVLGNKPRSSMASASR